MPQTILFTFTAQDIGVAKAQDGVKDRLKQINQEIKNAKALGNPYDKLLGESVKLNRETAQLKEQQKLLNKEFAATKVPKDSLAGLRLEYDKLIDKVKQLSAEERASPAGKSLIKNTANVRQQVTDIEATLGRFTNNVGNYKGALSSVVSSFTGGLIGGGIAVGATQLISIMKEGTQIAVDYEKSLSRLSAITGVTGPQLEGLKNVEKSLRDISVNGQPIVTAGQDILDALTLVGSAQPELLDDAVALGEVTKQAIILSKASGDDLNSSIEAITTTLGQFNQGAEDSARIINELAAGSKLGSSEIPQTTAALKEFGKIAQISNVTTAESIALIETEAKGRLRGAEAGTQLRNILIKLDSADILPKKAQAQFERLGINVNVLKDRTLPLIDRLKELGKATGDVTALAKIFGVENVQGAAILTSLIPDYEQLTKGIEGTSEAYKQAAIQADNTSTGYDNLAAAVKNKLQSAFEGITPFIRHFNQGLTDMLENGILIRKVIEPLQAVGKSSNIFDGQDPFGPQAPQFGVIKPLTEKEKTDARNRAIELSKITDEAAGEQDKKNADKKKHAKDKEVFAAGSLGGLQQEFDALQKKINNTPGDSPLLAGLIKQSQELEQKIQSVKNIIDGIRNPTQEKTIDQWALELATGINPEEAVKQAQALRDKLGAELGGGIGAPEAQDPTAATLFGLDQSQAAKDKADADRKKQEAKDLNSALEDAAIQSAQTIADAEFQIQQNNLKREQDAKLNALNAQEQAAIEAAHGNATKEKAIRANFDKQRAALEKKFANDRKELARKEALINIALSITKALTGAVPPFNFILAGLAAVAGFEQLRVINSQEFAGGGKVKRLPNGPVREKQNAPRTAHGDTVLAYVKPGEMMLNEQQQRTIGGLAGHDIFQKAGVPGAGRTTAVPFFASGGVVDFVPQATFSNQAGGNVSVQANAQFSDDQVADIGKRLGATIAATVAEEIKFALAEGLYDANRRLEREAASVNQREG